MPGSAGQRQAGRGAVAPSGPAALGASYKPAYTRVGQRFEIRMGIEVEQDQFLGV